MENWRAPFYLIAAERGEIASCPSRLLWDDIGTTSLFHPSLWPNTAAYNANHLAIEPSLDLSTSNRKYINGENQNLHFNFLSDIRYKSLTVRNVLDVDRRYNADTLYSWNKARGATGRIEEAWAQMTGHHWFVRFGRLNRSWGPMPDRSLVLSNNPYSFDALEWQVHAPFFEFRHLVSAFPRHGSELDTRGTQLNRYLSAHTLHLICGSWASLGITETVVFGRQEMPDFAYINPVSVYTAINSNQEAVTAQDGGGNCVLAFDGWAHPFTQSVLVWGQVAFDDIQVDNESAMDQEPTHWSFDAGASIKDFTPLQLPHYLAVRYRYLSKWIYTVHPGNVPQGEKYTYLGKSLGFEPIDGDELEVSATITGKNFWAVRACVGASRQDTGSVATPWPIDPSTGTLGYRDDDEAPLSKRTNAEKTLFAKIVAYAYFRDFAMLTLTLDNRFIRNKDHIVTDSYEYDPHIEAAFTISYSDLILRLNRRNKD